MKSFITLFYTDYFRTGKAIKLVIDYSVKYHCGDCGCYLNDDGCKNKY